MKLHQSAWALLPWTSSRPGLPRSPQASSSILAPSTSTKPRSGSWATAQWNQAGAGGSAPSNAASGACAWIGDGSSAMTNSQNGAGGPAQWRNNKELCADDARMHS